MQRYVYKIEGRQFVFYRVQGRWFYGRGCHMRALSHLNATNPTLVLNKPPVPIDTKPKRKSA